MLSRISAFTAKYRSNDWFWLTCIFLFVALVMLPIPYIGIPNGKDLSQHLQFAATYHDAILTGDFFPGWAAVDNYDFGSVGIRFYPPVGYYVLALAKMLTGDWFDAIWITFFCWMLISAIGMYFWAKEWLSPEYSAIAAALYVVAPYHLSQIYQTWLYAEFVASAVLPFCFLFAVRVCRRGRMIDVLSFAAAFSLLLLSHIPTTLIGSIGLAVYILFLMDWTKFRKTVLNFLFAFALTLSATAFHWIKIITEFDWVKHSSPRYASGFYDFRQYLFPMIYSAGDKYWKRLLWHFDVSTIFTFLLILPAIVYSIHLIRKNDREERRIFLSLSATGLFTLFIMSVPGSFVWESSSLLQKVQFPWRWLSILSVVGVMAFTLALSRFVSSGIFLKRGVLYPTIFLLFSILIFDLTQNIIQSEPIPRSSFKARLQEIYDEPGCPCWWATWAKDYAFNQKEQVLIETREVRVDKWSSEEREFSVGAGEAADLRVATFYYPHWQAIVNGKSVQIQKDENGVILIPVGSEKSSIKLIFQEPKSVSGTLILSLLIWTLLLGTIVFMRMRKSENNLN